MRGKKRGLLAVRRGKPSKVPQEEIDKHLPKISDAECEQILNDLYDPKVWEKEPGVYAKAVAAYKKTKGKGLEAVAAAALAEGGSAVGAV